MIIKFMLGFHVLYAEQNLTLEVIFDTGNLHQDGSNFLMYNWSHMQAIVVMSYSSRTFSTHSEFTKFCFRNAWKTRNTLVNIKSAIWQGQNRLTSRAI